MNTTPKIMCSHTKSMNEFKSNPDAAFTEGDAVAVMSNDSILFYAVPVHLYEDMVNYI